ncbi:MAG: hypothetical protein MUF34_37565 [Polyangiaceae bacterium]|nr:hypothetical protein [Polyangiaceae bacterium]
MLQSGESFAQGTWLRVRLDAIVNGNGGVVLAAFRNDLALHPLGTPPDWQPIAGNSGSQPLTSGRSGFGFAVRDVTRRGFFDNRDPEPDEAGVPLGTAIALDLADLTRADKATRHD